VSGALFGVAGGGGVVRGVEGGLWVGVLTQNEFSEYRGWGVGVGGDGRRRGGKVVGGGEAWSGGCGRVVDGVVGLGGGWGGLECWGGG